MTNTGIMPLNFPRQHFNTQKITLGARESILNRIKRLFHCPSAKLSLTSGRAFQSVTKDILSNLAQPTAHRLLQQ